MSRWARPSGDTYLKEVVGGVAVGATPALQRHFGVAVVVGVGDASARQPGDVAHLLLAGQVRFLLHDGEVGKVGRVEAVHVVDEEVVAVLDVNVQHRLCDPSNNITFRIYISNSHLFVGSVAFSKNFLCHVICIQLSFHFLFSTLKFISISFSNIFQFHL